MQSVGGLSAPTSTAVGFLVEKLALGQGFLLIKWGTLERTVLQRTNATTNSFINKIRMLEKNTDATMNECYNEQFYQ
jgi:hypothetical protein